MKKISIFFFGFLLFLQFLFVGGAWGQVYLANQSFDGTTFVPSSWTNLLTSGSNTWSRVTTGSDPTCSPRSGAGMAMFNSYSSPGTGVRSLITPVLDFSPTGTKRITFWMYRDNGWSTTADKIQIYTNTSANLTGATLLGTINRSRSLAPTVGSNGWYEYFYDVTTTSATTYVIFKAVGAYGNNMFLDDIKVEAPPVPCTGTPTAGSIASNTSQNICSGATPSVLTVTGSSSGVTGITYQWEQSTDNATWSNATGGTGATSASYTPPSFGGTTIYYRCKVTCTSSTLFAVTNSATISPPANPTTQATSITFSSISYTGLTASWTIGNGNRRLVLLSNTAIIDPTNTTAAAALSASSVYTGSGQQIVYDGTGTSVTVTGLNLATTYYVKVIEYTRCGSSTYDYYYNVSSGTNSNSVTTTAATPVPWTEGFATTTLPTNWVSTAGSVSSITAVNPALGSNYYYVNLYGSQAAAAITTPIIGSIPSNYRFTVKYKLANYSSPYASPASGSGDFIVAISTDNGSNYTNIATIANNAIAGWQDYTLNLSAYVGQNIRIRITGNRTSGDYYLAFDEFKIEAIPSCLAPSSPIVSSITNAGATLSWTAPATVPGSGYEVYYSTTNTAPTAGTTATATVTTGTSLAITSLTANTTYYTWVRSNCGSGDVSAWVASASFTTQCDPITSFPWTEGFEGVTVGSTVVGASTSLPSCWNSQSTKWSSSDATTYNTAKTGTKYIRYAWSSTDAFIWTPGFQLTAGVSYDFSFYAQGDGFTSWVNDVYVNTSVSSTGATQLTPSYSPTGAGITAIQSYNLVSRTFVPTTSGIYYFAIRGNESTGDPWYMAFDDFKLEETPACLVPTALTISAITNAGATLSWTAPSTVPGSGYEVYYSATNTAPTAGTTPTETVSTGTSLAIAGLTANTTYYAWVRSNCGSGDVSAWGASASFSTLCDPISSLPWTEGFESITSIGTTVFPDCWVESNGIYWTSLDAAEDSYNDPRTGDKYIGCDYGVADQRIWTPGFQLTAGVSYDFSTYFVGDGYSGWDGSILSNTSQSGTGETVLGSPFVSSSTTTLDGTDYTLIKRSFIPSTTGVYYFGIKISANYVPYGYIGFDDFKLEETPAPTITTVNSSVACGGSTLVTITGTNLSNATSVKIGGTTISPLTTNTATQITATVSTAFSGTVEVVTASGTATSASSISYTTAPILTVNTTTQTNCSNVSNGSLTTITSTVGDYDTYTWSPTTAVTGDETSGWSLNPTATTSYVLTASNGSGCTNTISKSVTVNNPPSAITLTPAATTGVCLGDVKTLVASGGDVNTSLPNYTFSSVSGTFSALSGGTTVSAVQTDDIISSAIPIGFTFNYNGLTYSNVYPSSNGFLSLNSSSPSNSSASNGLTSVSSTIAPLIAPLWDDLDGSTGTASYLTSGSIGNRIFTFEWLNWEWNYSANAAVISFQVKLYEATGKVEFVYRQESTAVNTSSSGASIGLTGSAGTYWSLNNSSSTPTASKTSETSTITTKPATGQVYSFTPPSPTTKSWSPTTALFTNSTATTAYTGNPTTVYAKPTATTTYTATATNSFGCTSSASVAVTVATPSTQTLATNDYVWKGTTNTDWSTESNWVKYDGTAYPVASDFPGLNDNVFIPQNNTCVVNQPSIGTATVTVNTVYIEPSATVTGGSGTLDVKGDFTNNGTFTAGTGTVSFTGTAAQQVTGATSFYNLTQNNAAGLTMNNPVSVTNNLTMTAGDITTATNLLTLGNSAPATLTWTSGKVVGPMKRWMAATTNSGASSMFPIGNSTRKAQASIEYTTAPTTAGYLEAKFIATSPANAATNAYATLTDQFNYVLDNVVTEGYWEIKPSATSGVDGGVYTVNLEGDNISLAASTNASYTDVRVIKSPDPHTSWILQGDHGAATGTNADFTVSRTGMSGYSFFAMAFPSSAPLPIELVSFAANCADNNTVAVNWTTASEHNSDYYTVEKSRDGISWNVLKTIPAAGNSTQLINYSVADASDISGTVYYRLTQVDVDGASKMYDIVSTNCSSESELSLIAYPNPSNGQFTVKIENALGGKYELAITDMQGKAIEVQSLDLETGTTVVKLNPVGLQPGVYLLQFMQDGNMLQQQKLVIE
jgi:hypothetical protein